MMFDARNIENSIRLPDKNCNARKFPSSYTLQHQISVQRVLDSYVNMISTAQGEYKKSLAAAQNFLEANLYHAVTMQNMLGEPAELSPRSTGTKRCKDGTLLLSCPVPKCFLQTSKLRRHFSSAHQELVEHVDYLVEISRSMEKNIEKSASHGSEPVSPAPTTLPDAPKSNKNGRGTPNLLARKNNFKQCSLCSTLVINITQHLIKRHKLSINEDAYKLALKNSEVVPKCHIKYDEFGKPSKMDEAELNSISDTQVLAQLEEDKDNLKELKDLRDKIAAARLKMNENPISTARLAILQGQIDNFQTQYKLARYADRRPYTEHTRSWREAWINNLTRRKLSNPQRQASMAMDVIIAYERSSGSRVSFEQVIKPRIIRCMLQEFINRNPNMKSSSKIKYIKCFQALLDFLLTDMDSPENEEDLDEEEMKKRDSKMERVRTEVKNHTDILSKDCGFEKIDSRKNAQEKVFTDEEIKQMTGK